MDDLERHKAIKILRNTVEKGFGPPIVGFTMYVPEEEKSKKGGFPEDIMKSKPPRPNVVYFPKEGGN